MESNGDIRNTPIPFLINVRIVPAVQLPLPAIHRLRRTRGRLEAARAALLLLPELEDVHRVVRRTDREQRRDEVEVH